MGHGFLPEDDIHVHPFHEKMIPPQKTQLKSFLPQSSLCSPGEGMKAQTWGLGGAGAKREGPEGRRGHLAMRGDGGLAGMAGGVAKPGGNPTTSPPPPGGAAGGPAPGMGQAPAPGPALWWAPLSRRSSPGK